MGGSLYTGQVSKTSGYTGEFPLVINTWSIFYVFQMEVTQKQQQVPDIKKISFNGMTEQFISKIWYHLLINNWVLNVILAGILLFLIIKRGKKNFLTAEMSVVFCGFSVYSVFHKVYPQWVLTVMKC